MLNNLDLASALAMGLMPMLWWSCFRQKVLSPSPPPYMTWRPPLNSRNCWCSIEHLADQRPESKPSDLASRQDSSAGKLQAARALEAASCDAASATMYID